MATWIRFPGLPPQFYHKQILRTIAQYVSDFIKLDLKTTTSQRGHLARVAVVLDLNKPLITNSCPFVAQKRAEDEKEKEDQRYGEGASLEVAVSLANAIEPWIHASRRGRPGNLNNIGQTS
ncbi:hypothetical protein Sjap_026392 [Stephania japonica]|uniref:DUF4283 domain-containing protein n=1 Tax=Stephania japonica TaxID=461633 RepID=A0AAP0HIU7_9MAGN